MYIPKSPHSKTKWKFSPKKSTSFCILSLLGKFCFKYYKSLFPVMFKDQAVGSMRFASPKININEKSSLNVSHKIQHFISLIFFQNGFDVFSIYNKYYIPQKLFKCNKLNQAEVKWTEIKLIEVGLWMEMASIFWKLTFPDNIFNFSKKSIFFIAIILESN